MLKEWDDAVLYIYVRGLATPVSVYCSVGTASRLCQTWLIKKAVQLGMEVDAETLDEMAKMGNPVEQFGGRFADDLELADGSVVRAEYACWNWDDVMALSSMGLPPKSKPSLPASKGEDVVEEFYRLSNEVMRRKLAQFDEGETWKGDE